MRIVWKHLPLRIHAKAEGAHAASEAAHQQGQFWEMHDLIFAETNWQEATPDTYVAYAEELGLDVDRFKRDMDSATIKRRVQTDSAEAARLGVTGTPGFFVNGKFLSGAQPFASFKRLIDDELNPPPSS